MPNLSDLVLFHSGTSIKEVNTILYFRFLINYYKLTCCMETIVDPDQLASSEAS